MYVGVASVQCRVEQSQDSSITNLYHTLNFVECKYYVRFSSLHTNFVPIDVRRN